MLERRAEEVLSQEELAPRRWAERLAPDDLPDFAGFDVGRVYQPGTGLMAGDFYDVFRVAPQRMVAVIGAVTGHGIEPSITAFQAKYLLRVFLRQFRDPAQALEELNVQMSAQARPEEFISVLVTVFDTEAGTLRFASAGHPAGWLWHDREVQRELGQTLYTLGHVVEARTAFEAVIAIDPQDAAAYQFLAPLYAWEGRMAEAERTRALYLQWRDDPHAAAVAARFFAAHPEWADERTWAHAHHDDSPHRPVLTGASAAPER